MKIYFTSFSSFDVKSYEVDEETITVDEFVKMVNEFASHSEDLGETCEIEIALREFEDEHSHVSLKDMVNIFNDVVDDWSRDFAVYIGMKEGMGYFDGDEITVEISDLHNCIGFGIENQTITFKNLHEDAVKSFEEGVKEWLSNLKYEVYDEDDFFDIDYTKEKFDEDHVKGIKKFLEFIESGEFRDALTPSDEYFDFPNIICLIDHWNEGDIIRGKVYDYLSLATFME